MHRRDTAFSLVEVTLALGIIAFALIAILGLVPVAQNAGHDAADDTKIALIEQDAFTRARAAINTSALFASPPSPLIYYYTNEGVFFADNSNLATALSIANSNNSPLPNFAASVAVGVNFSNALPNIDNTYLKPAVVSIGWPLDSSGSVIGANTARKTCTFYIRKP
jgi:uncharacterized protein (TIGR02598 family)